MRRRARAVMILGVMLVLYVISPLAAWALLVILFSRFMMRQRRPSKTSEPVPNWREADDDDLGSLSERWIIQHRSSS